jgi:hypothetical protein
VGGGTTLTLPQNEGTYITLQGQRTVRPSASVAQTVAIPLICDWGPLGSEEIVKSETFGEWESLFGNSDTPGRDAALAAFVGTGIEGNVAAGAVKSYRMATSSAAASTVTLKNTKEGGKSALKLTARYTGERGDRISMAVAADPTDETKARFTVMFDGVRKESYSYTKIDLAELAAKLEANSSLIPTVAVLEDGVALATTASTSLAGGNNGDELTSKEWLAATEALEFEDFSVFVPYDLSDKAIRASLFAWTQSQAEEMRPVFTIFGGPEGEELIDGIERAREIEDPHVIAIGGGDFHDDFLDKDISTAQLAPRIAGILAGLGESKSLLNVPIAGLKQIGTSLIAPDEQHTASENGLTVFRRTTIPEAELVIANGVTTFTDDTDLTRPVELFSDPRIIRVADLFIRRMKEWGDRNIVGPTTVTEETEAAVRERGDAELKALTDRNLILPGKTPDEKPFFRLVDNAGKPAIVFEFGWVFARTTRWLIGRGSVR